MARAVAYRLLIVEDNEDIARLIRLHARDLGCEADIAGDGVGALEQFQRRDYQLVVLDIMLPGIDGLEVCRQSRARDARVPIVRLHGGELGVASKPGEGACFSFSLRCGAA